MPSSRGAAKRVESALLVDGSRVEAVAQTGTVALLDARLPSEVRGDNLAALERFKKSAAPFYAAIRDGADRYGECLRLELNALAGGEAPPSVMALAQAAVDAHANCQLAQHILGHATGDLERLPEKKQPARRLEITQLQRTAMGLDVAFTDLVRRATDAAKASKANRPGGIVAGLLTSLGVGEPAAAPASVPDSTPPAIASGSLPTKNQPHSGGSDSE